MTANRLVVVDPAFERAPGRARFTDAPCIDVLGEAANVQEAADRIGGLRPDVVLVDADLLDVDALAATRRLLSTRPAVGVILLTAFDDHESVFAAKLAGAKGFVTKPWADPPIRVRAERPCRPCSGDRGRIGGEPAAGPAPASPPNARSATAASSVARSGTSPISLANRVSNATKRAYAAVWRRARPESSSQVRSASSSRGACFSQPSSSDAADSTCPAPASRAAIARIAARPRWCHAARSSSNQLSNSGAEAKRKPSSRGPGQARARSASANPPSHASRSVDAGQRTRVRSTSRSAAKGRPRTETRSWRRLVRPFCSSESGQKR